MVYPIKDIAYCSNVHPGESVGEIKNNLTDFIAKVAQQRDIDAMCSGLWISGQAAAQLQDPSVLADFKRHLDHSSIRLTSINGFPFGDFHQPKVKAQVYLPDWSEPQRLLYSKNLATILAACLPDDGINGAISTLPLGYKTHWSEAKQALADAHLIELALFLAQLKEKTGKHIRVCLEMEPDCVLETTDELIDYFTTTLQSNMSCAEHLAVCYDVCHQAVMFEPAYQSLERLVEADICIGKIQLSSALIASFSPHPDQNKGLLALLGEFCEPRYLHQVKSLTAGQQLLSSTDLSAALAADSTLGNQPQWRIHFHVPVNAALLSHPQLTTTRDDLLQVFDFLQSHQRIRPWLEVETYSWQVLPERLRPTDDEGLIRGIVAELNWVINELMQRGLIADEQ